MSRKMIWQIKKKMVRFQWATSKKRGPKKTQISSQLIINMQVKMSSKSIKKWFRKSLIKLNGDLRTFYYQNWNKQKSNKKPKKKVIICLKKLAVKLNKWWWQKTQNLKNQMNKRKFMKFIKNRKKYKN